MHNSGEICTPDVKIGLRTTVRYGWFHSSKYRDFKDRTLCINNNMHVNFDGIILKNITTFDNLISGFVLKMSENIFSILDF